MRSRIEAQLQARVLEDIEIRIANAQTLITVHQEEEKLLQKEVAERVSTRR
jgi:hypothetical protein